MEAGDLLDFLLQVILPFTVVVGGLLIFWALPVYLGVCWAREKGYSPMWMLFGINPVGAWIAAAILQVSPPRRRCTECHRFIRKDYAACPYCRCDQLEFVVDDDRPE